MVHLTAIRYELMEILEVRKMTYQNRLENMVSKLIFAYPIFSYLSVLTKTIFSSIAISTKSPAQGKGHRFFINQIPLILEKNSGETTTPQQAFNFPG